MSPPPVNVTRFVNSTTIHLECKDVDSHCLFLFDGLNAIPLHNNTEKCVNIPFRRYVTCVRLVHIFYSSTLYIPLQ